MSNFTQKLANLGMEAISKRANAIAADPAQDWEGMERQRREMAALEEQAEQIQRAMGVA
jgi:hypothetical protein